MLNGAVVTSSPDAVGNGVSTTKELVENIAGTSTIPLNQETSPTEQTSKETQRRPAVWKKRHFFGSQDIPGKKKQKTGTVEEPIGLDDDDDTEPGKAVKEAESDKNQQLDDNDGESLEEFVGFPEQLEPAVEYYDVLKSLKNDKDFDNLVISSYKSSPKFVEGVNLTSDGGLKISSVFSLSAEGTLSPTNEKTSDKPVATSSKKKSPDSGPKPGSSRDETDLVTPEKPSGQGDEKSPLLVTLPPKSGKDKNLEQKSTKEKKKLKKHKHCSHHSHHSRRHKKSTSALGFSGDSDDNSNTFQQTIKDFDNLVISSGKSSPKLVEGVNDASDGGLKISNVFSLSAEGTLSPTNEKNSDKPVATSSKKKSPDSGPKPGSSRDFDNLEISSGKSSLKFVEGVKDTSDGRLKISSVFPLSAEETLSPRDEKSDKTVGTSSKMKSPYSGPKPGSSRAIESSPDSPNLFSQPSPTTEEVMDATPNIRRNMKGFSDNLNASENSQVPDKLKMYPIVRLETVLADTYTKKKVPKPSLQGKKDMEKIIATLNESNEWFLEVAYKRNQNPRNEILKRLAENQKIPLETVQSWFKNRQAKESKNDAVVKKTDDAVVKKTDGAVVKKTVGKKYEFVQRSFTNRRSSVRLTNQEKFKLKGTRREKEVKLSESQILKLEKLYRFNKFLSLDGQKALADEFHVKREEVVQWFVRRRASARKVTEESQKQKKKAKAGDKGKCFAFGAPGGEGSVLPDEREDDDGGSSTDKRQIRVPGGKGYNGKSDP